VIFEMRVGSQNQLSDLKDYVRNFLYLSTEVGKALLAQKWKQ
jgi:hypothetical protein